LQYVISNGNITESNAGTTVPKVNSTISNYDQHQIIFLKEPKV